MKYEIDPSTGARLIPGRPKKCEGNGEHPDFECCCFNCDYYSKCFPLSLKEKIQERRAWRRYLKRRKTLKNQKGYSYDFC